MAKEKQELHCHNCDQYVRFDIDLDANGEYEIPCPNCGHMHCRVVKDGFITDKRWDSRNGNYITIGGTVTSCAVSFVMVTDSTTAVSMCMAQSWANTTCAT